VWPRRRNLAVVRTIHSAGTVVRWLAGRIWHRSCRISGAWVSRVRRAVSGRSSRVYVVVGDINIVVVLDRAAATPVSVPTATPVVVAIVDKRPEQNPGSERQDSRQEQITPAVTRWRRDRGAVSTGWIVLRHVNRIRLRRLNDDRLLHRGLRPALSGRR